MFSFLRVSIWTIFFLNSSISLLFTLSLARSSSRLLPFNASRFLFWSFLLSVSFTFTYALFLTALFPFLFILITSTLFCSLMPYLPFLSWSPIHVFALFCFLILSLPLSCSFLPSLIFSSMLSLVFTFSFLLISPLVCSLFAPTNFSYSYSHLLSMIFAFSFYFLLFHTQLFSFQGPYIYFVVFPLFTFLALLCSLKWQIV